MSRGLMPTHFSQMARYNQWMNERLYAACRGLDDAARKRDMGAFFGSIHRTLNHLLFADRAWMARFEQRPQTRAGMDGYLYEDFDQLSVERSAEDAYMVQWADALTDEWLALSLEYTSFGDGLTRKRPRSLLVGHLFNHQTHHRGQITTLLSQLGIDVGVTDLPAMPVSSESHSDG